MTSAGGGDGSIPIYRIDDTAAAALQNALAAEHAALWSYSLIVAFLPPSQALQARTDELAHTTLRGAVEETLTRTGRKPVTAQPAYALPRPVTDGASAAALAVVVETDCLVAWRAVVDRSTDQGLRQVGLTALTRATRRCARWRVVADLQPAIPTFPGQA